MKITEDCWIQGARRVDSPFCDSRPDGVLVSLLVIHNISLPPGQYGGPDIEALFTGTLNPDAHPFFRVIHKMKVSAHCLIRRDGEIVQFVPFDKRAWHAGQSSFAGVPGCNDYSIGIELEGTDHESYTQAQYHSLASVTNALFRRFPDITQNRVTGHQYIAPQRKTDPGLVFNWKYFRELTSL